ncbi:hypothetical protein HZI73_01365 [Vallitalea pronyensis]|uniref:D-isomer specific 2-hydroxyacid dehydrogenase NAD-binding domain-containing protein n=1 Tax=Vallitalea pronyensis TaxID=1348613 RepID=A0A8J8MGW9_9FIRM|nr:NAD(P)-dependent oxidoreductase [Vallitalea pronyensis]QUI21023.1 hypothetical protein HZI73_01365 [Vallitalea pronyensis]
MDNNKIKVLINLPEGFYRCEKLAPVFKRIEQRSIIRKTSHNTPEDIMEDLKWAEAVIMWSWPELSDDMIEECPHLRYVGQINSSKPTAKVLLKKEIALSEARHAWSPAVAEMALTLMLTGLRKVSDFHMAMRQGTEAWIEDFPMDIDPLERQLTGRRVGIVGFGRIGQRLAELLQPFNTTLRAYDPYLPQEIAKSYHATLVDKKELFENSEIIVLCAANTREAEKLVGREEIASIQKNGLLVNVGRASLVDMEALTERLQSEELFAMLDVFDKEPLEKDSPLRTLKNAWLTPHKAGGIMASVERALTMLMDDFEATLEGKERKYSITSAMLNCLSD